MSVTLIIILSVLAVLVLWFITTYNKFVSKKLMVNEGYSGIDVQLKRRFDLIPNLIETVKGYMGHEKSVLEKVTEMRTNVASHSGNIADRAKAEGMLSGALNTLFAVAENYPDLKASANFGELQRNLAEIEDQVQLSRRYYNGSVRDFNTLVSSIPSNIVAGLAGFKAFEFFEIENAAEKAVPKVSF